MEFRLEKGDEVRIVGEGEHGEEVIELDPGFETDIGIQHLQREIRDMRSSEENVFRKTEKRYFEGDRIDVVRTRDSSGLPMLIPWTLQRLI